MIPLKTMSQSVPWQTSVWNIHLSMLMSASWIIDAGILPGFSMPGLIWRYESLSDKHTENRQLRPSFVSHKLWNFPEARELNTNRDACLSSQMGCTQTPSVHLSIWGCSDWQWVLLSNNGNLHNRKRELPSTFLPWWLLQVLKGWYPVL